MNDTTIFSRNSCSFGRNDTSDFPRHYYFTNKIKVNKQIENMKLFLLQACNNAIELNKNYSYDFYRLIRI